MPNPTNIARNSRDSFAAVIVRQAVSAGEAPLGEQKLPYIDTNGLFRQYAAMSRTARVASGGLLFHVLNRGVGRMQVFRRKRDFEAFPARDRGDTAADGHADLRLLRSWRRSGTAFVAAGPMAAQAGPNKPQSGLR
jgi:hypothetical protein